MMLQNYLTKSPPFHTSCLYPLLPLKGPDGGEQGDCSYAKEHSNRGRQDESQGHPVHGHDPIMNGLKELMLFLRDKC